LPVKTKSIFAPIEDDDGRRILITRYYPRGVKKEQFDDWGYALSPTPDLLFSYKDGKVSWDAFKEKFIIQLRDDIASQEAIRTLHELSENEEITLLCFEKSGNPCHRHLVRDIVENPKLLDRSSLVR
jgi:uncharacterized protein YeaO (DUF488 family)